MNNSRLVYSTGASNDCPQCGKPLRKCHCASPKAAAVGDGIVRLQRETKGRGGKHVTIVSGLTLAQPELKVLAKKLKAVCGTGGTVKNGLIEIQGDRRELIKPLLEKEGWTVKLAGG